MTLFETVGTDPTAPGAAGGVVTHPEVDRAPEHSAARTGDDLRRVALVVAYDGTDFRGFAPQEGVPTVGGTLAEAVGTVLGTPVTFTCAGRTDAGVHGWGQVVSFDVPDDLVGAAGLERLQRSVNRMCAPAIVVRHAVVMADSFDARFSATGRSYRYRVLGGPVPDPFRHRFVWHVPEPLDLRALTLACDPLIGEHDFTSFCRAAHRPDGTAASSVRRVTGARWVDAGDGTLEFQISASAFCHQMVRSIVGTLVEVGRGRRRAGEVMGILRARDRAAAGQLAPPTGLCLWSVDYPQPDLARLHGA